MPFKDMRWRVMLRRVLAWHAGRGLRPVASALLLMAAAGAVLAGCASPTTVTADGTDWSEYLGGPDSAQFSPLTEINRENVTSLAVAWTDTLTAHGQTNRKPLLI